MDYPFESFKWTISFNNHSWSLAIWTQNHFVTTPFSFLLKLFLFSIYSLLKPSTIQTIHPRTACLFNTIRGTWLTNFKPFGYRCFGFEVFILANCTCNIVLRKNFLSFMFVKDNFLDTLLVHLVLYIHWFYFCIKVFHDLRISRKKVINCCIFAWAYINAGFTSHFFLYCISRIRKTILF
jgi:hypothetical protein